MPAQAIPRQCHRWPQWQHCGQGSRGQGVGDCAGAKCAEDHAEWKNDDDCSLGEVYENPKVHALETTRAGFDTGGSAETMRTEITFKPLRVMFGLSYWKRDMLTGRCIVVHFLFWAITFEIGKPFTRPTP